MLRIKKRDPKLRIHPNAANESAKNESWLVVRYSLLVVGLFLFLITSSSLLVPLLAHAEATQINPNLPGLAEGTVTEAGPGAFVVAFYRYALMLGGILAFGAIVYGGVKVTLARGNPASLSDAKEWIKSALLGLLLLVGAFLILNTISPGLTTLNLPELEAIEGATEQPPPPPGGGEVSAQCQAGSCTCEEYNIIHATGGGCTPAPSTQAVAQCVTAQTGVASLMTGGHHNPNSCHFGGRSCTDGGHAFDFGINGAAAAGRTLLQMKQLSEACATQQGASIACFYENAQSQRLPGPEGANHIHCNVDNAGCGCN